ncbi:MAG: amino acid permease [Alphaproteobacteria bacterium]|nr:amino acid permease [Alphaproteobacteria bacterium]
MQPTSYDFLKRDLGVFGATMMGLGSIVGTGVFVSIGIAAGVTGPSVILAIALAAGVALCNALSSAQLAASHAVSGGTYEYGYKYLNPAFGFTAGWMFLCAKTASAATAALGFAGYLLLSVQAVVPKIALIAIALATVAILTFIVLMGIRQSNRINIFIVSLTFIALLSFVLVGIPSVIKAGSGNLTPFFVTDNGSESALQNLLYATALMFVAYTGYGRIATLGEEVKEPKKTIPRAITLTLIVSALLYMAVGLVAVMAVGSESLFQATQSDAAPLDIVSRQFVFPQIHWLVALGAMTAMLGVLLNLILGLSRILLAMGRRGDIPSFFANLNKAQTTPYIAVITVGLGIAGLVLTGNIKLAWSFSAFTVLIYYAITNLAALRLSNEERLYPRAFSWGGLISCLFLSFWVEWHIWLAGLGLIAGGLAWHKARESFILSK